MGGTQRKPTTFGRALTVLFSREDWVRVHIKMTLLGIEPGTLEVKGEWSDHYTIWRAKMDNNPKPNLSIVYVKNMRSIANTEFEIQKHNSKHANIMRFRKYITITNIYNTKLPNISVFENILSISQM